MNRESMSTVLATAQSELSTIEQQIAELTRRADALRQIITGVESYLDMAGVARPDLAIQEPGGSVRILEVKRPVVGPRGKDAVRAVLMEQPGEPMTAISIAETIETRGWIDSDNALDATRTNLLRAMKKWPNIERVGQGVYVWNVNPQEPSQPVGENEENAEGPASAGPSDTATSSAVTAAGPDKEGGDGSDDDRDLGHHPAPVAG